MVSHQKNNYKLNKILLSITNYLILFNVYNYKIKLMKLFLFFLVYLFLYEILIEE